MGFDPKEAEELLVATGRRCCICGRLHKVQVHHIQRDKKKGRDQIDNGIPLCPNCHDEAHAEYTPGRTTRTYTARELRLHRKRTVDQVKKEGKWTPGSAAWKKDKQLIAFFAQCLDRPAFRTYFHQELSFVAFDQAMEDTLLALNTGYWKMRDGTLIERTQGKSAVVNPKWRKRLDDIAGLIEQIRKRFHEVFGLNEMLYHLDFRGPRSFPRHRHVEEMMESFRHDQSLGEWMDQKRQEAIGIMNSLLDEVGMQPLRGLHEH